MAFDVDPRPSGVLFSDFLVAGRFFGYNTLLRMTDQATSVFHVKQSVAEMLHNRLGNLGISSVPPDVSAAASMLEWLAPAAARIGLTQFSDPIEFAREIALPVLDLMPHIPSGTETLAEIGPGSGGAGLTIASLRPDLAVSMIDRRSRVCAFIDVAAAKFDIDNVHTQDQDLHELAPASSGFDIVMARAVAPAEDLIGSLVDITASAGHIALYHTASKPPDVPGANLLQEIPTNLSKLKIFLYQRAAAADANRVES